MKAIKDCREPFSDTFFQGYTQGRPTDTVKIGIDLDAPEPTVQELAITAGRGLHPFGPKYFTVKTIELAPDEVETLSIWAFTKRYGCSFTLQIIVATSYGSFSQDIDNHGKPFEVTAMAAPTEGSLPFSGYKAAYLQNKVLD